MRALRLQHGAFCSIPAGRPAPHQAVQHRVVRAHAAPPSATYYSEELVACEGRGDAVRMTELLTEVRVLKVQGIPPCTMESGVRTLAAGGEWQRAVDLLESIRQQSPGHAPSAATLECVVSALAAGQQAHRALAMLDGLLEAQPAAAPGSDGAAAISSLSPAYNVVARALARQESTLQDAHKLLESMTSREDISVEPQTFNTLALAFLKAGDGDTAEEILEMRDYL